ncbi:unnamed protein product [Durusdinium trenchii]|uniref:Uncharacterized protein n=1 Tax=Durusdinium trenchii TaxID=1381693 RepID=A0ABP0RQA6_9DINO
MSVRRNGWAELSLASSEIKKLLEKKEEEVRTLTKEKEAAALEFQEVMATVKEHSKLFKEQAAEKLRKLTAARDVSTQALQEQICQREADLDTTKEELLTMQSEVARLEAALEGTEDELREQMEKSHQESAKVLCGVKKIRSKVQEQLRSEKAKSQQLEANLAAAEATTRQQSRDIQLLGSEVKRLRARASTLESFQLEMSICLKEAQHRAQEAERKVKGMEGDFR